MIQSINAIASAMGNAAQTFLINKATLPTQIAGGFSSLWRATGVPSQGSVPAAAALCTKSTLGSIGFTNPTAGLYTYIGWLKIQGGNANTDITIADRLAQMGGLSGTVTTAQTAGVAVTDASLDVRRGASDFSDVCWFLEWYTATGSTGVTATISYTNGSGTAGRTVTVSVPASTAAGRLLPIIPSAGEWIRSIESVTLSATTGTAGSFGVTATRFLSGVSLLLALGPVTADWAALGFPRVADDACLQLIVGCGTTSSGAIVGQGKLIQG